MVKYIRAINKKGENEKCIKYINNNIEYILYIDSKYIKINYYFVVNKKAVDIIKSDYIDYKEAPKNFIEKIYKMTIKKNKKLLIFVKI